MSPDSFHEIESGLTTLWQAINQISTVSTGGSILAGQPLPRKRDVTVAEVAKAAGVAKATASRALGGYGAVSDEARSRVVAAAARLRYRPNGVAIAMNTGRSRTIGVVVGDIENGYFGIAMRGISDVAQAAGYDVVLLNSSEDPQVEAEAVRVLLDKRVDGLIVAPASAYETEHLEEVVNLGRPLVLLDRRIESLDAPSVWVDLATATEAAVDELVRNGHQRIAFLSAMRTDGDRFTSTQVGISSVADRLDGITRACAKHGIPVDPSLIRFGASDFDLTRAILDDLLANEQPPTAVIASDSRIALNVLRALRQQRIAVPSQISLVVLDALEWTEFANPSLAGVTQPTYAVGQRAAQTLLAAMAGKATEVVPPFPSRFELRASIAPPPRPSLTDYPY